MRSCHGTKCSVSQTVELFNAKETTHASSVSRCDRTGNWAFNSLKLVLFFDGVAEHVLQLFLAQPRPSMPGKFCFTSTKCPRKNGCAVGDLHKCWLQINAPRRGLGTASFSVVTYLRVVSARSTSCSVAASASLRSSNSRTSSRDASWVARAFGKYTPETCESGANDQC